MLENLRLLVAAGCIAASLAMLMAANASDDVASIARRAPPFLLETPTGSEITLRTYAGRPSS